MEIKVILDLVNKQSIPLLFKLGTLVFRDQKFEVDLVIVVV